MKYWFIVVFSLVLLKVNAQNEYVNWYFGVYIGLNFCDGLHVSNAKPLTSDNKASATISDKTTGQMLFHTDGETVWNNQYQVMQNGTGLNGSSTSSQGALIVPQPENDSIFYIFTTGAVDINPQDGLEYSIVNIHRNNGLGAVISKNIFLHSSSEKLTAVYNKIGDFFWVLSLDSDNFIEYKLDAAGLNTAPVLYPTNVVFNGLPMSSGFLKFSPNANSLACTFELPDTAALYGFNNNTGVITFMSKLQLESNDYDIWGLSFSPNSTKLYAVANTGTFSNIYQFDLTSGNTIIINNSRVKIYSYDYAKNGRAFGALQLGPDKKLYLARLIVDSLNVIEQPESAGLSCDFKFNAIFLDGLVSGYGLSNNIDNLYEWAQPQTLGLTANVQGCNGIGSFTINTNKTYNGFEVNFGDGTDTTLDSLQFTGTHYYAAAGIYTINIKGLLGCVYDSVSTSISIPAPCVYPLIIPTLIYGRGSQTQWHIINLPQGNNGVTIYNELGQVLYKTNSYPNDYDMRNLPPAMYFYRLTLESGQVYVGKILVLK